MASRSSNTTNEHISGKWLEVKGMMMAVVMMDEEKD